LYSGGKTSDACTVSIYIQEKVEATKMNYQVNEIFTTVQGEGHWSGVPATFIRLQGCTVGCPWCDTKYTWAKGGAPKTVTEILTNVNVPHVVITGGEPTLYDLDDLINGLRGLSSNMFIQLETSGQNALKGLLSPDWITWSPKRNLNFDAPPEFLAAVDEVKFVVDTDFTNTNVEVIIGRLDAASNTSYGMTFMPEGCPPDAAALKRAFDMTLWYSGQAAFVRMSDRLQYRAGVK
jgi:7-carboxy-7-deazaguanine synthase